MTYSRNRTRDLRRAYDDYWRRHRWRVARRVGFVLLCVLALAWLLWMAIRPTPAQAATEYVGGEWRAAFDGRGVHQLEPTEGVPETYLPDWKYPTRPRGE